jgi:hypothetical protein
MPTTAYYAKFHPDDPNVDPEHGFAFPTITAARLHVADDAAAYARHYAHDGDRGAAIAFHYAHCEAIHPYSIESRYIVTATGDNPRTIGTYTISEVGEGDPFPCECGKPGHVTAIHGGPTSPRVDIFATCTDCEADYRDRFGHCPTCHDDPWICTAHAGPCAGN